MIIAIIAIILGLAAVGPIMSDVEIPNYTVLESRDNIEIRQYDPMIIAKVEMNGEREEAINDGFRILADYIFGNNAVTQDIAMTAPVQQQTNAEISMTAPVEQQSSGDSWKVSFVMPSEYTMATLPRPINPQVTLKQIPARKYVVITFSGTNSTNNLLKHEKKLIDHIESTNLAVTGSPKYAYYNPPWTLPTLRRNEIMFEIKE